MKRTYLLLSALVFLSLNLFAKEKIEKPVLQTKYFELYSNPALNEHMFMYNNAIKCKLGKVPGDSLADRVIASYKVSLSEKDKKNLNETLQYYIDSLLIRDLLFNPEMTAFSDLLVTSDPFKKAPSLVWQQTALAQLKRFSPTYTKLFWKTTDNANKAWAASVKNDVQLMEASVIEQLEKIYQTKMPVQKVRIDLAEYATWAGAYTYTEPASHIIISSTHKSNQGMAGVEVLFHEASHLLVDKVYETIIELGKTKPVRVNINLWHNIIFYTTGYVLTKEYTKHGKTFAPFYVEQKFEERFSHFKYTVDACKLYWDKYIQGEDNMNDALNKVIDYVIENGGGR